jgi:hypothetical protein
MAKLHNLCPFCPVRSPSSNASSFAATYVRDANIPYKTTPQTEAGSASGRRPAPDPPVKQSVPFHPLNSNDHTGQT